MPSPRNLPNINSVVKPVLLGGNRLVPGHRILSPIHSRGLEGFNFVDGKAKQCLKTFNQGLEDGGS